MLNERSLLVMEDKINKLLVDVKWFGKSIAGFFFVYQAVDYRLVASFLVRRTARNYLVKSIDGPVEIK